MCGVWFVALKSTRARAATIAWRPRFGARQNKMHTSNGGRNLWAASCSCVLETERSRNNEAFFSVYFRTALFSVGSGAEA